MTTTRHDLECALVRLCKLKGWRVSSPGKRAAELACRLGVPIASSPWARGDTPTAYLDHTACYGGWCVELNGGARTLAGGWPSANRQPARSMLHSLCFAIDVLESGDSAS